VGANLREENLGDGGKYVGVVANKLAPYDFFFWRKHRIAVQKKIANMTIFNFPHSVLWAFAKSMVLSFSANPTKRPTGVRKMKKTRRWASIWFGENDVCPRRFQRGRIGGLGRG